MRSFLGRLFVSALMLAGRAAAVIPNDPLSGYTAQQWQSADGLPEQTVQAFAQSADGYLWIGTSGGLLRFDGAHFREFSRENTPAFAENSVFSLTAGRDGTLWIGTEGGGLIRLRDGVFHLYSAADGISDGFVRSVLEDRGGAIWIGTDNGLFRLPNSSAPRASRVDGDASFPGIAVHALYQERSGRIWVGGSRLVRIDPASPNVPQEYPLPGSYSENRVKSVLEASDGTIWVGTVSGLEQMRPGSAGFVNQPGIRATVRVLRQTANGALWIGTIGQGAFTYRAGALRRVAPQEPLPSSTVLSVLEDTIGNVWLGTEAGLVRLSRTPLSLVPLPDASDFETISADSDGSLWIASTRLFHMVHGKAAETRFPQLHGARVRNVFRDRDGTLWIGTDGRGLFHLNGPATQQYTTGDGMTNNFVRAIVQARDGDLWVATDEGCNRIVNGELRTFRVEDGLAYFSVRTIAEGQDGDIWIGTDRGLSHLRAGLFVNDAATKALAGEKIWAIHVSNDGSILFGTRNNGLYRLADGKMTRFSTDQGLASNSIYSIVEDARKRLWIGTPDGVSVLAKGQLDTGDTQVHLSQRFYSHSDAGDIAPLYGGTQPAAAMDSDGNLWFPTNKGPVRITDAVDSVPVPVRLVIDQVVVDGRKMLPGTELHLASGNANLEISYAAILLSSQEDLRFAYKLDGFDEEWRYASSRRTAYYTNLPAGHYTFRVRVVSAANPGDSYEVGMAVLKDAYFYRTPWFYALCIGLVTLAIWVAHLMRVRRMHTEFRAVLDERARLAREMHDTLIQGCASVSVLLEACSSGEIADSTEQYELIDYARTQLAASIDEARQAVWNLRSEHSDNLSLEMQKLADRVARESNVAVSCQIEGEAFPLRSSAVHELLMIGREALYNAALHASPTQVSVSVNYTARDIVLEVSDNGCGFDQHQPNGGHYGLVGIQERVRQLGGTLRVRSTVSRGTDVCVVVPRTAIAAAELVSL